MTKIRFAKRTFDIPGPAIVRIVIGVLFIIFGLVGFLPIVGFWMVPLGLLILSIDLPLVRRWRRRLAVWWERRRRRKKRERAAQGGETC